MLLFIRNYFDGRYLINLCETRLTLIFYMEDNSHILSTG